MSAKRPAEQDTEGPRKRLRSNYTDTVTILVGAKETSFTVHQDRLCSASDFFKKACTNGWLESKERVIRLADVDTTVFHDYLEALYSPSVELNKLLTNKGAFRNEDDEDEPSSLSIRSICKCGQVDHLLKRCELWVFGDFLQDHTFQNKVMDSIYDGVKCGTFGSVRILKWLSNHTTATSLLAKFLRRQFAEYLTESNNTSTIFTHMKEGENKVPADMLVDLLKDVLRSEPEYPFCATYHVHPNGTETCAQRTSLR
ncbi:hypothetical protein LTR17_012240 [Elasticomyces elasticus]|nr:hypothetical protein LTR17_012240 [Elasticomyces elasticus]